MRRMTPVFSLALILGIITIVVIVRCSGPSPDGKGQFALPTARLYRPVGEPAIKPTLPGQIPAFTGGDVCTYVTTNPMPFSDTPSSSCNSNQDVQFLTSKQVNTLIGRQGTGIPDNYPLCLAVLHGSFTFPAPPAQGKPPSATYSRAYEVFDSTNGNLLMGGALLGTPVPIIT